MIYLIATKQEDRMKPFDFIRFNFISEIFKKHNSEIFKKHNKEPLVMLKERLDELRSKASDRLIPMLAPNYFMAKIIMAFQKEVQESQKETSKEDK